MLLNIENIQTVCTFLKNEVFINLFEENKMTTKITPTTIKNADGADIKIMQVTGDQTIRVNFTKVNNQLTGVDLNDNGRIDTNAKENNTAYLAKQDASYKGVNGFQIFDAYTRNPLDTTDTSKGFVADVFYNGTGVDGDGISTNGNIYLGGLGVDYALGGIGNDFMVGGGVAAERFEWQPNDLGALVLIDTLHSLPVAQEKLPAENDYLSAGRNADFFFADLSAIDGTDGNGTQFDGGTTTDDAAAGLAVENSGVNSQNNDWLLLEANDDDEPVQINLQNGTSKVDAEGNAFNAEGSIVTNAGAKVGQLSDIESIDASGNLYGFINSLNVTVGEAATDERLLQYNADTLAYNADKTALVHTANTENFSIGSTAQLNVTGSAAANVVIAGYDNDKVNGMEGDDILMGGNLSYLLANQNNANLLNKAGGLSLNVNKKLFVVNDGMDTLLGGADNDNIVFEMDGGKVAGGANRPTGGLDGEGADTSAKSTSDGDTLWLTDFSMGRIRNVSNDDNSIQNQKDAFGRLTTPDTVGDTKGQKVMHFDLGNDGETVFKNYGGSNAASQDQNNYAKGAKVVAMTGMESIITTGLGAIDFKAAGNNSPELAFHNQQNFKGINLNLSLLGSDTDNTLYANTGNDIVEGRRGDDNLSGGKGDDRFVFRFGDGVDTIHRQQDSDANNLWDTDADDNKIFTQDFRAATGDVTKEVSRLKLEFKKDDGSYVDFTDPTADVLTLQVKIGDKLYALKASETKNVNSLEDLANKLTKDFNDPDVLARVDGNTLLIEDTQKRDISDTFAEGFKAGAQVSNKYVGVFATFIPAGTPIDQYDNDIIVIKDYASRTANIGVDLANNESGSQAAQMVAQFSTDADTGKVQTYLAQQQNILVRVSEVNLNDVVSVTVNDVQVASYTAKLGDTPATVVAELIAQVNGLIDKNTTAGLLVATAVEPAVNGDDVNFEGGAQFSLTQQALGTNAAGQNGSLVYMNVTVDAVGAVVDTHDQSGNNIHIFNYDGRDSNLNQNSLRFIGSDFNVLSSILKTAKDAGGPLAGTAANAKGLNGDDLLIGGIGNDDISGGTGDDRVIASKGTDIVNGGPDVGGVYTDVLQAEEVAFGKGTTFTVALDTTKGAGTITAVAADATDPAASKDVTTFTNIEVVRVMENSQNSTLDLSKLSDYVASASVANGSVLLAGENLTVNAGNNGAQVTYAVDSNNNAVVEASEKVNAINVFGTENLITGNANDIINVTEAQASSNNKFSLGSQQDSTATKTPGADVVSYNYTATGAAFTVKVESAANTDTVINGGTDTLVDAEVVNFNAQALNGNSDTLDLSAITAGATVNYAANLAIGGVTDTLGNPVQLNNGGVAASSALTTELVTVGGIAGFEGVLGSEGSDRAIAGNTVKYADGTVVQYNWNLAAGSNDTVDYRGLTGANVTDATVVVATDAVNADLIGVANRVDSATGVETYIGALEAGDVAVRKNLIDLTLASVDSTVEFTVLKKDANGALVLDPTSNKPVADTVADPNDAAKTFFHTDVRSTATPAELYASFLDNDATNKDWSVVVGGNKGETVLLKDQDASTAHTLTLAGGSNVADYSAVTTPVTLTVNLSQNLKTIAGDNVTPAPNVDFSTYTVGLDNLSITRADALAGVGQGDLTVKGTAKSDSIEFAAGMDYVNVDLAAGTVYEFNNVNGGTTNESFLTTALNFDNVTGTAGNDTLSGTVGVNTINGGAGDDLISGMGGSDSLVGNDGNDTILGGASAETIVGGNGDDQITGFGGNDVLTGGAGNDQFIYTAYTDSYDPNTFIDPSLADPFDNAGGTFAGLANPFVSLAGMPITAGGASYVAGTLDLNFDAETLTDFTSGQDKVVIQIQDTADMLHVKADSAGTPINYFALGTDGSVVSNTTTVVTTNTNNGLQVGTPVKSAPVTVNSVTNDGGTIADTNAESAVILSLGSDKAVGTTVNVTNATVNGVTTTSSSADASSVDSVLTLETPATLNANDFLLRIQQSAGTGQVEDLAIAAGGVEVLAQVQYTAANQSQAGLVDTFKNMDFRSDQLDFTKMNFAALLKDFDKTAATPLGDGIQTDEILRVDVKPTLDQVNLLNNGFNPDQAQNPDLFANNGKVLFVLQAQSDPLLAPGSYRLFVDADQNGAFDAAKDMVIDFANETNTATVPTVASVLDLVGLQVTDNPTTAVNEVSLNVNLFMV